MNTLTFCHTLGLLLLILSTPGIGAEVLPYRFPPEFPTSELYEATVGDVPVPVLRTQRGSLLNFGMAGPVEVRVKLSKAPKDVVVRPLSAGIKAEIEGDTLTFRLPRPSTLR